MSGNESTVDQRAGWGEKIAWGIGGIPDMLLNSIPALAMPIYSIALGVSPGLVGLAVALPRLTDAITDPVMGNISDNTHTRWGRRRPFILIGALLMLVFYPLMWMPPAGLTGTGLFIYFSIGLILFYLVNTVWSIPWQALGLELSDDYHDRTTVQTIRSVFVNIMSLGHGWLYPLCFVFNENEAIGIRYVGLLIGLAFCVFGLPPALFCREKKQTKIRQEKTPLFKSMGIVLRNRPFMLLCAALTIGVCGSVLVQPMWMYTNIYYVFNGDKAAAGVLVATAGTVSIIATLILLPVGNRISKRFGKKRTALASMGLLAAGKFSYLFTQHPSHPYLQLISNLIFQPATAVLWMLIPSMIADVCDLDELQTGHRREAIFSAVYQWVWKLGSSLAIVVGGCLLSLIGAKGRAGFDVLPPDVVLRLRLIFYIVPAVFVITGAVFMYFYPLTHERVDRIKLELKQLHEKDA
ncbi:MAG: MFS transporter [Kiritimatiellales bacterium]